MNKYFKEGISIFRIILAVIITAFSGSASAQQVHKFTKGLAIQSPASYGREAIYTDVLAFNLYSGTLGRPFNDAVLADNEQGRTVKWSEVAAGPDGRLRIRTRTGGYVYLTYNSLTERAAVINISGNSAVYVNNELHTGDPYSSGWMNIPLRLKKGLNEFYVRGQNIMASLTFTEKPVMLDTLDVTAPYIVSGRSNGDLKAAIVVVNTSTAELEGLQIMSRIGGKEVRTPVPLVPPLSTRKVMFKFNGEGVTTKGRVTCSVSLMQKGRVLDSRIIPVESVDSKDKYINTFISAIDGSLQYYAVTPSSGQEKPGAALFLSVHGAGVEAIGQAKAYQPKDWGNLVAATNRRPRGFNWEDWGRLDALEVLSLAKEQFKPDPQKIYLTGHSMGGHGTWFLGATYPDKWAAIAPCAGYPTLKGYGSADGLIPDSSKSAIGQVLLRASNQSDVPKLAYNYKSLGVYILHGDADRTVPVTYARQMKQQLSGFHPDFSYYEYPGGSHWYSNESVDWKPLFDYFKWHTIQRDTAVNTIDFTTASPGISSSYRWASIHQQVNPLKYSRLKLNRDRKAGTISGTTENIQLLKFGLSDFGSSSPVIITLDNGASIKYTTRGLADSVFLQKNQSGWIMTGIPDASAKGPHRYGTFKEGFNKNMVFVYGTSGTKEENEWSLDKARFDSETWYYRGNGAVDIISDKEYSRAAYAGRNVVLIGNASTNSAWNSLLSDSPVQVSRGTVLVGSKTLKGDDLAAYFVWPISGTASNLVAVITGSGLKGMNAANGNQYFAGASGFPDIMVYRLNMLQSGVDGVEIAGFFDNDWKISGGDLVNK
jgi:pimeloyl-ACP methyl ester carboxylesterase